MSENKNIEESLLNFINRSFILRAELNKESDRGCVLMSASFLDYELKILFEHFLNGSSNMIKETLDGQGILATFSSKIKFAYMLGLISKKTMDDLNIIRKIRNDCGHGFNSISFEDRIIAERVKSLKTSIYSEDKNVGIRRLFVNNVYFLVNEISSARFNLTPVVDFKGSYTEVVTKEVLEETVDIFINKAYKHCGYDVNMNELMEFIHALQVEIIKHINKKQ